MNIKEFIPVQFEAGSVFKVAKNEATLTLADSKKYADDKTTEIDNKYTQLKATTDEINSTVGKQTTTINNLSDSIDEANDKITTITTDVSNIKQTSSEITSTVTQIKNSQIGNNEFIGVSGIGWNGGNYNGAQGWQLDYNDYVYLPPIDDVSGDYILSFGNYTQNLQVEIYSTNEFYKPYRLNYYCNFNGDTELPIILIEEGDNNDTLKNTYLISCPNENAANLKKDDIVVVKKHITSSNSDVYVKCKIKTIEADTSNTYGTTNNAHKGLYKATFTEFATTDENYKQYASYLKLTLLFTGNTNDRVVDGTANKTLNYVAGSSQNDMWVRFQESIGYNRTFLVRMKSTIQGNCYVGFVQVEDCTKMGDDIRPHKFSMESGVLSSSIKQTANEILAQVNDTYVKIGDGNITLNGDTKVNGSLTLNDSKQGFLLMGNGGTTEISPKSIGSYSAFKDRTSNTIRTYYLSDVHGELNVGTNNYAFFWSVTQKLGTYKKGDYIKLTNYTNDVVTNVGTDIGTPYAKFYINENGTQTKAIDIGVKTNVDIDNYTVVNDNADIQVTGQFHIYAPKSIWNQARGIDTNLPNTPFINVTVEWDNEVPNKNSFMLIGYDGFGVNFGTNKTVYCGAEGFIASYGDSLFKITSDGIVEKKNGANVEVINGSSSIYSPSYYNLKEGVDTILCKSGYIIITLPSNPYQGQSVKIFDKSPQEVYVNFNGYMVGANSDYNSRTHQTKYALDGTAVRTFTFIGDTWFMEYMG